MYHQLVLMFYIASFQFWQGRALTCKIDALYYATSTNIIGVFADGNSTTEIITASNAKLNYDKTSERLIYFTSIDGLKSVKIDGSDPVSIATRLSLRQFTVDYLSRKVYYVTDLFGKVKSIDIASGLITAVNASVGTIKDLDTDPRNNSLVFTNENGDLTDGDIVRYFIDKGTDITVFYNSYSSPICLAVDSENEVIYWVNYTDPNYDLIATFYNGTTTILKEYSGVVTSVKIAIGYKDFYVLVNPSGRIDRFNRESRIFQDYFVASSTPSELTVGQDLDECCVGGYCHDNATCTNTPGSYICSCSEGFTGNATFCQDIDECWNEPCHTNATCNNTVGSFLCACDLGYNGGGFNCSDIDECWDEPCNSNATCNNTIGSFMCACDVGYIGNGFTCTDIADICVDAPCHANVTFNYTIGYIIIRFECYAGYTGDGCNCTDIECWNEPCHTNATCNNTDGSFLCACDLGYNGGGINCSDIDECWVEPCHSNATCNNTIGSFMCACDVGYTGNGFTCTDNSDVCGDVSACHANATCNNTVGYLMCECDAGYTGDGFNCTDMNECDSNLTCRTHSTCENSVGSYTCTCNDGYLKNVYGQCVEGKGVYSITMTIKEVYLPAYGDRSSTESTILSNRILGSIDEAYESNINFLKAYVTSLQPGSIIVNIQLVFQNTQPDPLTNLKLATENGKLGELAVDKDSIKFRDPCVAKPCSPNATCTDLKDGQYQCICKEGFSGNGTYCAGFVVVTAKIIVEEVFTEELKNKSSQAYLKYQNNVKEELVQIFKDDPDFIDVIILDIRNGSIEVHFKVVYRSITPHTNIKKVVIVVETLQRETKDGFIGNLSLLPQNFVITEPPPPPVNISHTELKETQVIVKWDPSNLSHLFFIKSYLIMYHPVGESVIQRKEIISNVPNVLLENLKSETFYNIYLRGKNEYGEGENSESIQVKTKQEKDNRVVIIASVLVAFVIIIAVSIAIACYATKRARAKRTKSIEHQLGEMK